MCEHKYIQLSRKGRKLYRAGWFLILLVLFSIPCPVIVAMIGRFGKYDIEGAIDILSEQNEEWEKVPFVDIMLISNSS